MRIGFLSVAHVHAEAYVHALRAAGAEVAGVYDHDAVRGAAWARRHGVDAFATAEELFDSGVHAVVVCSETVHNRSLVEAAARAGVGVLCEKPLATTEADAQALVRSCAEAGVVLMTAFPMRFSPAIREARALLVSGRLGEVYSCTGTNQAQLPPVAWFAEEHLSGGGAVMDHSVHLADLLRWLLGRDAVEVYAATNRVLHREKVDVETGALLMLGFDGGVFASIDASWSRPADYPTWGGLTLELVGEHGVVSVDPFRQHLTVYGGGGPPAWPPWGSDANEAMMVEFLDALREGRTPAVTGEDGLAATRVALAAYRSAAAGEPVALEPTASPRTPSENRR